MEGQRLLRAPRSPLLPLLLLPLLLATAEGQQGMPKQMTIAAIFDQGGDRKHEMAFKHAVQGINRNRWEGNLDGQFCLGI